jgi:hypothetical protein
LAANKTARTEGEVGAFLDAVPNAARRADGQALRSMMERATGERPYMYGPSIVGFGSYHYRYESGREGDAPLVAFSPRSNALVLYLAEGYDGQEELAARLGKHKSGKSCLYVTKLSDVDPKVLEEMVMRSAAHVRAGHRGC